ncbi:KTSC domain-containing protein [Lewinella sp. JB7]|uniref:KTSC domain-containing protein n=1 Tax=Lewinella sp. JB7 TaxID=2962887 RepID=UPI0020C95EE4|nr:KTSC domain-containing protein [Lewinella sp. JB7]MCP9235311.1 KTSC domain-containing protein [Lewinella sp. JB7]
MKHHNFGKRSEMVSFAGYDAENRTLYLTFLSGGTTIAYFNVSAELYDELVRSPYPDVCLRFKIQAKHPFRRVEPAFESIDYGFIK